MHRFSLTLLLALSPFAQEVPPPVARALAVLEEARALAYDGSELIWPGFELAAIPIALYTQDEAFVVHHRDVPDGFEVLDSDIVSTQVLRGPRTEAMNANTSGVLGGAVSAFVSIASLGSGPIGASSVALIVHESAHAFRERAPDGGEPRWPAEDSALVSSYPVDSAENNAWGRVEGALLAAALGSREEVELLELLRDFVSVRGHRQALLSEEIAAFERRLELNEGLAEYFARRAVALADASYSPTPGASALGLEDGEYGAEGRLLAALRADLRRVNRDGRGASRQRFYLTGAAQGLLLDRVEPHWKRAVEQRGAALQDLLAAAVRATSESLDGRLERVAAAHGYEELLVYERAASVAAAALRRARLGEALSEPGMKLVLDLSQAGGAGRVSSFDPMNIIAVERGLRLHTRMLSLDFDGGRAVFGRAVVQDLQRALVIATLSEDAEIDLDTSTGGFAVRSAELEVACATSSWVVTETLLLVRPGPVGEELDAATVTQLLAEMVAEAGKPLPAPPFELLDLAGAPHRHPEDTPRRTALVFFSAASWARPAHRFARSLLEELDPAELAQEHVRLLLVAAQCDRESLDAFLGETSGSHVLHDPDRELTFRYGVEVYPTVVWISEQGTVDAFEPGGQGAGVGALIERLR